MTTVETGVQQIDLLDSTHVLALYGGENGLTVDQIVAALDPLCDILSSNPDAFTRVVPALADNLLTKAYLNILGRLPDKTTAVTSSDKSNTETLILLGVAQNGAIDAPRSPAEASLHFLPLPYAKRLIEIYGATDKQSGFSHLEFSSAVQPLIPHVTNPKIKTFIGPMAEGLIRRSYLKEFGRFPTPHPRRILQ